MRSASGAAVMLLQAATAGRGTAAEAILFKQLGRLSVAILDAHTAAGDAHRARQLTRSLQVQLAAIQERLPALNAEVAAPSPPERTTARRESMQPQAPARSPLPNPLEPRHRTTHSAAQQRDDNGRD